MRRQRNGKKKSNNQQEKVDREEVPDRLPMVIDQLSTGITLRFITTAIGATSVVGVTFNNLLDAWMVATGATTAFQLFDFVKVRRVTIRAVQPTVSTGGGATTYTGATVGVEFLGLVTGSNAGGKSASDSALGSSRVAMVSLRPDKLSGASFWQTSNNNVAFVVRCSDAGGNIIPGAIVDVELSYKNGPNVSPVAIASAIAGGVAGNLYFGGIDGGRLAATWARSAFSSRI